MKNNGTEKIGLVNPYPSSRCISAMTGLNILMLSKGIKGTFYWYGLTEIKAWICNCIDSFTWDVITQPCPHFNGGFYWNRRWSSGMDEYLGLHLTKLMAATDEVLELIFHPTLHWACDYLSILELKLIHDSKGNLSSQVQSISRWSFQSFAGFFIRDGWPSTRLIYSKKSLKWSPLSTPLQLNCINNQKIFNPSRF